MNCQQDIPYGLLYSVAPEYFDQAHLASSTLGDNIEREVSENQYEGESLASNVVEFLKEMVGG